MVLVAGWIWTFEIPKSWKTHLLNNSRPINVANQSKNEAEVNTVQLCQKNAKNVKKINTFFVFLCFWLKVKLHTSSWYPAKIGKAFFVFLEKNQFSSWWNIMFFLHFYRKKNCLLKKGDYVINSKILKIKNVFQRSGCWNCSNYGL